MVEGEKEWVKERGRGKRGRIYNREHREREEENGKGRYFGSCEKNK